MKLLRRSDLEGDGPRREDAVEVFVRYVEAAPGVWVAEADAPPARVQAGSIGAARRCMVAALAGRIGAGVLDAATVIEDLPEEAGDDEDDAPEADGAEDG